MEQAEKFFDNLGALTARRRPSVTAEAMELVRAIVHEGCIDSTGDFLKAFVGCVPTAEWSMRDQLPAIVLNRHLVQKEILAFDEFFAWTTTYPNWREAISEAALDGQALQAAVDKIEQSMRQFAEAAKPTN